MAAAETAILNKIMIAMSAAGGRCFRNNRGMAWVGQAIRLANGDVLLKNPRQIRYGVGTNGGSDLIGWMPVDGKAIFSAIEVKTPTGRIESGQQNFIDQVLKNGGFAGVARSADDAKRIMHISP